MRISAFILASPALALAQQCSFDDPTSLALTSIILDCYNKLNSDAGATLTVSGPSEVPCYQMARDRSSISEVVVRRLEGHDGVYSITKGQVACAAKEILGSCQFGDEGRLVGGEYGVCDSGDLYVQVQGEGN